MKCSLTHTKAPQAAHPFDRTETERAILFIKRHFQDELAHELNLLRVTAPLFIKAGTGINDDLNGVERPVTFAIKADGDAKAVVVHSLAKWKRIALSTYGMRPGEGLYTDMNAIRADEELDAIHSLYVDQWDWERVVSPEERTLEFLKTIVQKIYRTIRDTELAVAKKYPDIKPELPARITFVHAEDLEELYPTLTPKEREHAICKKHGAVFLIGIGGELASGTPHDGRASDYDDWSTATKPGYAGLNGDILVWNPVLKTAFELSSMGIRVDKAALERQLALHGHEERKKLLYHRMIMTDQIPLSIGGGIGQSRLCMYLLRKEHIGQVQASIWPDTLIQTCKKQGIELLG
ncbi:aspartate--ammonia ligase [Candidatus Dependentiae bacterium HGW-Dependentiae-1]|nr:MAG: aspartate--ammonia ligase [Candidatus Dependentiae bacterium HGW-Dependentiae-1]